MKRALFLLGLVGASLMIGAIISLFFRDWLREQIVLPLTYMAWILRLLILSLPQALYWGILLLIGLFIGLATVSPKPADRVLVDKRFLDTHFSRYSIWLRYTSMLNQSNFAIDSFGRDLVRLSVQILASQQKMTAEEVYTQLDRGEIDLPVELKSFLRRRGFQNRVQSTPFLVEIFHRFFPARNPIRPPGVYTPLEKEAVQILAQIEGLLSHSETSIDEILTVEVTQ